MSSKKLSKIISSEMTKNYPDYDYIYKSLNDDFEETISGLLNAYRHLLKKIDIKINQDKLDDINTLLNTYIKKNKNKKTLELLYDKINVFLDNISKTFDDIQILSMDKYISDLIDIQNKCLLNPLKKHKSEKYNFIMYLIFEKRNIELLSKYLTNNMKEILINRTLLQSVFANIIEKYMETDEDNQILINYYNQVINLFLREKIYDKLFKNNKDFIEVLKTSNKEHVWELINRIEDDVCIKEEDLCKQYNISYSFPNDLEEIKYTSDGMVDFTNQSIITIDSELDTCLDDALFIEKNKDGTYTIYIHVANPPSIIPYNSKVMQNALRMQETIPTCDKDFILYPEYLTYDLLSILPNKQTNVMTFIINTDTSFNIDYDSIKVMPGVVINKNKLSYKKVDKILEKSMDDELSKDLIMLSDFSVNLAKEQRTMRAYHRIKNISEGTNNTDSAKADVSIAHSIIENNMILVNRLSDIINKNNNYGLPLPYRIQPKCNEQIITKILSDINNINPNSKEFRKIIQNYMISSKYSPVKDTHDNLRLEGYVRVGSAARRAMDALALYVLNDLVIHRDEGYLDVKNYFWEEEVKYWCEYANLRNSENNNFAEEYNYLSSKGKILKK